MSLLIDPWLQGEAFNESWSLYPQPTIRDEELARVTHIWISHEHPDHLSIPTIRAIPAEVKARIILLFQKRYDTEIVEWLRGQGFKDVWEMRHKQWIPLADSYGVACYQIGHMDSALAIRGAHHTRIFFGDFGN